MTTPAPQLTRRAPPRELFRKEALLARERGAPSVVPFRVPALWTRLVIFAAIGTVIAAVVAAFTFRIESVSVGRGMLRASGSPQVIAAETDGTVTDVLLHTGQSVSVNQEFVRLGSAGTAAELLDASRHLELAEKALEVFLSERRPALLTRRRELEIQEALLGRHEASHARSVSRLFGREKNVRALVAAGVAKTFDTEDAAESRAVGERELLRTSEQRAQVRELSAALLSDLSADEWALKAAVQEAQSKRESLLVRLRSSLVKAPSSGVMGAVTIRPGDLVRSGAPLGRVIPNGALRSVVAFVPEADRGSLVQDAGVQIEIDQLPRSEFGVLRGRVRDIAPDIALQRDLRDTLGDQAQEGAAMCRVEIALDEDQNFHKLSARLRPESLVTVRLTLRSRLIATLFFEPLQNWLR